MKNYLLHTGEYFGWFIENPIATWWKARKYFKFPKVSVHFFSDIYMNCPFCSIKNVSKILEIRCVDVQWKDKWDHPSHERDPYIWVCFFRTFGFSINFDIWFNDPKFGKRSGSLFYWEYMLDFLYYSKDINAPQGWRDSEGKPIPIREFSLKKKWL